MNALEQIPGGNIRWDLKSLYTSDTDPEIEQDIRAWTTGAKAFENRHRGHLAQTLPQAIRDMITLHVIGVKPAIYLELRQSLDTGDAAIKAKIAWMQKEISTVSAEYLEFFSHELVAIDDAVIAQHAQADPLVAKHLPWIKNIRRSKPHLLSEAIESALTMREPFGSGAWGDFFHELEADLRFSWGDDEKTLTQMLAILNEDSDGELRATALENIHKVFSGYFTKYAAQTLYMVAGAHEVETRERNHLHPMDERNQENGLPDAVVETLHQTVTAQAGPLARRFYRLKAALLGIPVLRWSDRNAPMPFTDATKISWDQALAIVLSAYRSFSPTLARLVEEMVAKRLVDAPVIPGKEGGAYNLSTILPNGTPISFTLLNFLGDPGDVMTLAHELGHGVHGLLSGAAQGPLMQEASIALCETASIFGEMTTFTYLKEELARAGKQKERLALIMSKLNDTMNSVVRQIGFSNFERQLHGFDPVTGQWSGSRKMSVEELDTLWLSTVYELYGNPGEVFTYQHAEHLWAFVPHFHDPFYVYGYAFGELLTQSLYAARPRLGDQFEPLYLDLLRAGSSKYVVQLLAPFGLNPTDPAFWAEGIRVSIEAMLEEAEEIARATGFLS